MLLALMVIGVLLYNNFALKSSGITDAPDATQIPEIKENLTLDEKTNESQQPEGAEDL